MAGMLLFLFIITLCDVNAFRLTQVLVLGRHNIRAPFINYNLESITPKKWPSWKEKSAYLTSKGALLESYMGEYFSEWLRKEELLPEDCPAEETVHIYANAPQRTVESARMFTKAAFKNCNVTVHYKRNVIMDPMFNPVIHNTTEEFMESIFIQMQNELDNLNLTDAYAELNRILDLNNSRSCKEKSMCDLNEEKDDVIYKIGEEPDVSGPLYIGNKVVDTFLMEYYNGMPLDSVAWGEIDVDTLKLLTRISTENQNIRFHINDLAKDVAKPMLNYLFDIFLNEKPKFTLLVGHDSNLKAILSALGFKPFDLPNQFEKTPVGGKMVFQKWHDKELNRDLLKINLVYQTIDQLRNGTKLSLNSPPGQFVMELTKCKIDENGYCPWDEFLSILRSLQ